MREEIKLLLERQEIHWYLCMRIDQYQLSEAVITRLHRCIPELAVVSYGEEGNEMMFQKEIRITRVLSSFHKKMIDVLRSR